MPRVEEKPPTKRVDELVSEITEDLWTRYDDYESLTANDREKRGIEMIKDLVRELAFEKAKNEILSR